MNKKGNLTGTAFGDPIKGTYDAGSGMIHFSRKGNGAILSEVFTGCISIISSVTIPQRYLLAGYYRGKSKVVPFEKRRLGWYATYSALF